MKKNIINLLVVTIIMMFILPAVTVFADWPPPEDKGPLGDGPPGWHQRENPKHGGGV
ncbi:hypothetical protein [Youngiibacter fragilis]|uniref:Uncharacterized protein n=1 Tax=Youngiibacter fragilis 232.1 TaxID=994573 RepID=V7I3Z3_9CLOT|nr:hypothetical protein [Youngiibacter fragilis]ETA79914.1 hypothetical protein T472_0215455 [Youngiibacter fragilis 232.1]